MTLKGDITETQFRVHISGGGPFVAGGPITASADVPGGPVLAGDHLRRDSSRVIASHRKSLRAGSDMRGPPVGASLQPHGMALYGTLTQQNG